MRSLSILLTISLVLLVNKSNAWWMGGLGYGGWGYGGLWNNYALNGWGLGSWSYPYNYYNYYGKRSVQSVENTDRIECLFLRDKSVVSCSGALVECDATPQMDDIAQKFDLFGVECDEQEINLFPKNFTGSFTDNRITLEGGRPVKFGIYASNEMGNMRGLMIRDRSCLDKMINLFNAIKTPTSVEITNGEKVTKASISGFVL